MIFSDLSTVLISAFGFQFPLIASADHFIVSNFLLNTSSFVLKASPSFARLLYLASALMTTSF